MKEYDLIFGIGEACSCTQTLRKMDLQFCSYPFDWLFGCTLENRIKILTQGFKDFINKEDLEFAFEEKRTNCNAYRNKANQITFNHDFSKDLPFDEAYEEVKQKYARRTKRLIDRIENANSILIVYMEVPSTEHETKDEKTITEAYENFKSKYPDKKTDLFYIKNVLDQKNLKIKNISDNITLFEIDYKKRGRKFDYEADIGKLKPVFKNENLNIIKKRFNKIWINLIFIKPLRYKLRKKYHI